MRTVRFAELFFAAQTNKGECCRANRTVSKRIWFFQTNCRAPRLSSATHRDGRTSFDDTPLADGDDSGEAVVVVAAADDRSRDDYSIYLLSFLRPTLYSSPPLKEIHDIYAPWSAGAHFSNVFSDRRPLETPPGDGVRFKLERCRRHAAGSRAIAQKYSHRNHPAPPFIWDHYYTSSPAMRTMLVPELDDAST